MTSSSSYEDYERDYQSHLSQIRTYLADSTQRRNVEILHICEQHITQAKQCATAMQAMAEIENDTRRMTETRSLLQRDIGPLSKEIQRTLQTIHQTNQTKELFATTATTHIGNNNTYQAPTTPGDRHHFNVESSSNNNGSGGSDLDALIQSSDDLLRESQSILNETEYIGNSTIQQMEQQREQLLHSHEQLHGIQTIMSTSQRIITSMSRRACRSRLFLHMSIGILIALNVFVLYWIYTKKYSQHSHQSSDNPPSW